MPKHPLLVLSLAVSCSLATYTHFAGNGTADSYRIEAIGEAETPLPSPLSEKSAERSPDLEANDFANLADTLYIGTVKKSSPAYSVLQPLFVEWGASDPHAAMAYLQNAPQGIQRFSKDVLRGWAQSGDLAGARAWIDTHIGATLSTPFYLALVDGLNDVDRPEQALELAQSTIPKNQPPLAKQAMQGWASQDLQAASRWIEEHEADLPQALQESVLSGYARAWAKKAPQAAATWAKSLPQGSVREEALYAAFDQWIQKDATAAGYWIFSQKKDPAIEQVLSETVPQIAHVDPEAAFEFIENDEANQEDPYRLRGHLIMALDNVMRKTPAEATPWIKRVEAQTLAAANDGLTDVGYEVPQTAYVEMVNRWAAEDEAAAFAYLDNAPQIDEAARDAIERSALDRLQTDDPEKAAYYLFKRWQDSDQASAVAFAGTLSPQHLDTSVSNFKEHYQSIAEAWGETEPEKAGFYVERQEFLTPEETAEVLVSLQPVES
ncbi:hypothetical protein [Pelagicoccus sp. SDUM812005]|uniref:hypothetical protein n=1 Tax=Pelagicoccus sp. SDUM812005 TaxID=3041257 RepID=UPI00280E9075|nr:hypothetical protein [Pelagicoccus sp. SDUM812005]MDQ8181519.1 hypothetical protein [Pelagicoccus sp. SDUM812005]